MSNDRIICPKCAAKNQNTAKECIKCGIVFEKYNKIVEDLFNKLDNAIKENKLYDARSLLIKIEDKFPKQIERAEKYLNEVDSLINIDLFKESVEKDTLDAKKTPPDGISSNSFERVSAEDTPPSIVKFAECRQEISNSARQHRNRKNKIALLAVIGFVTLVIGWEAFLYSRNCQTLRVPVMENMRMQREPQIYDKQLSFNMLTTDLNVLRRELIGKTKDEVEEIFGSPDRIQVFVGKECWIYGNTYTSEDRGIVFDGNRVFMVTFY